ncbi:MAG: hypothetical protein LAN70_15075 [Acidobacteriia bacterium]|nr:hypothetical protein [Terriglobia bacterium]
MDSAQTLLGTAEVQEKAVVVMQRCQTPDDVRAGFLQIAELMSALPGMETLVRSLKAGATRGALDDSQVLQLRQELLQQLPKQAEFFRQTARKLRQQFGKKWWQFWK